MDPANAGSGIVTGAVAAAGVFAAARQNRQKLAAFTVFFALALATSTVGNAGLLFFAIVFVGTVLSDGISVAFTRMCTRLLVSSKSAMRTAFLLLITAAIPVCFVVMPLVLAFHLNKQLVLRPIVLAQVVPSSSPFDFVTIANGLGLLALLNFYSSVVPASFLCLTLGLLLHHALWEIAIQRPLYALRRYNPLANHKKTVAAAGLALITASVPAVGDRLAALVKSLHLLS